MCLAVKICPGCYSVSVLECADVGERKGREGGVEGEGWLSGLQWHLRSSGSLRHLSLLVSCLIHIIHSDSGIKVQSTH